MTSLRKNERGFSPVEIVVSIVIIAAIVSVGWYVHKHREATTAPVAAKSATTATTTQESSAAPLPSGTSNSELQSDLSNVSNTSSQSNAELNTANSSINDQSTMTTVPQ
jgi:hypothetical protein